MQLHKIGKQNLFLFSQTRGLVRHSVLCFCLTCTVGYFLFACVCLIIERFCRVKFNVENDILIEEEEQARSVRKG